MMQHVKFAIYEIGLDLNVASDPVECEKFLTFPLLAWAGEIFFIISKHLVDEYKVKRIFLS